MPTPASDEGCLSRSRKEVLIYLLAVVAVFDFAQAAKIQVEDDERAKLMNEQQTMSRYRRIGILQIILLSIAPLILSAVANVEQIIMSPSPGIEKWRHGHLITADVDRPDIVIFTITDKLNSSSSKYKFAPPSSTRVWVHDFDFDRTGTLISPVKDH